MLLYQIIYVKIIMIKNTVYSINNDTISGWNLNDSTILMTKFYVVYKKSKTVKKETDILMRCHFKSEWVGGLVGWWDGGMVL